MGQDEILLSLKGRERSIDELAEDIGASRPAISHAIRRIIIWDKKVKQQRLNRRYVKARYKGHFVYSLAGDA